jgi:hypothetical protein
MKVLDEKITPALALAKQRAHLFQCLRIDLAALERAARPSATGRRGGAIALGLWRTMNVHGLLQINSLEPFQD